MKTEKRWYIMYTRAGEELKILHTLTKKRIECFCPSLSMSPKIKNPNNADSLLLPKYIFTYVLPEEVETLKRMNGVKNFMYWLNDYVTVLQEDIFFLRELIKKYQFVKSESIAVDIKKTVTIEENSKYGDEDVMNVSFHAYGFAVVIKESKINVRIIDTNNNKNQPSATKLLYARHF